MTETDEKWEERIRQWRESGKTAEEFASGQPYKASTLKWRAAIMRRSPQSGGRDQERAASGSIRLARVVARKRPPEQGGTGLVVEVSGARIAVSRGFDAQLLTELVRALGVKP